MMGENSFKPLSGVLLVSDIDGTIVREDSIFEFFNRFGVAEEAKRLNAAELSSDVPLLLNRIASQQPIPLAAFEEITDRATFFPGADRFFSKFESFGARVCLLSAMYEPIANRIAGRLGLSNPIVCASRVKIERGDVVGFEGPVMEGFEKEKALKKILDDSSAPYSKIIGLADSQGDLFFMNRIANGGGLCLWVDNPDYSQIEKTMLEWLKLEVRDDA
ncbi:MAG TPA: HAD-IB family phosphatase [Candidatus Norongarragalinales archaeon]|nr:HAD-IB family phosphatase [Candidatus Norongarragalinales archaeon]